MEKSLIYERVRPGVKRAKEEGVKFGSPRKGLDYRQAVDLREKGWSIRRIAKEMGVSRSTIQRLVAGEQAVPKVEDSVLALSRLKTPSL